MSKFSLPSLLCPTETVNRDQWETERRMLDFEKTIGHLSRRGFLSAFAAAAAVAAMANPEKARAQSATPPIVDVLNFALNLEYLEANFYLNVSAGTTLSATDMGAGAVAAVGLPGKLTLDANTLAVVQGLAADETHHVELLRSTITTLGGTPISQPLINYAAHGAITTQAMFLAAARQFTALGGSAYVGSAQYLISNPAVLTAAAQILGAEGQHAGVINNLCVVQNVTSPAIDAQDVPPSSSNYFTVSSGTALSPSRATTQVLGVAYGTSTATTTIPPAGTTVGGFFPNGVNGNIKST